VDPFADDATPAGEGGGGSAPPPLDDPFGG
jgi:hypothetical protein